MSDKDMARPDGPGSTSLRSPEPQGVSAHAGYDPSRKSVLGRLSKDMMISFAGNLHGEGFLTVAGKIENRDQLDAVMTVFATMRDWLSPLRDTDGSPEGRDPQGLDGEAATAGAEGIADTLAPQDNSNEN